jgi:hypothetical protein
MFVSTRYLRCWLVFLLSVAQRDHVTRFQTLNFYELNTSITAEANTSNTCFSFCKDFFRNFHMVSSAKFVLKISKMRQDSALSMIMLLRLILQIKMINRPESMRNALCQTKDSQVEKNFFCIFEVSY